MYKVKIYESGGYTDKIVEKVIGKPKTGFGMKRVGPGVYDNMEDTVVAFGKTKAEAEKKAQMRWNKLLDY